VTGKFGRIRQKTTSAKTMITQNQDEACRTIAEGASSFPRWRLYGEYCRLRQQGLRKEAFARLNEFLEATQSWRFEERKAFVQWLCDRMESIPLADYGPFPQPLRQQLFVSTFSEWAAREPENAEVQSLKARYTGDFECYRIAIGIDPENQRARCALADACIYDIWYSTHHLPDYFIGDERDLLSAAAEAEEHISHVKGPRKAELQQELAQERLLLDDWVDFKANGAEDFDAWCKARGRRYRWSKAYYYN
jgi:hypothetical protein